MEHVSFVELFSALHKGLVEGDKRYTILNREHVVDNTLGIEYHLYDETYKITKEDETVFTDKDATSEESKYLVCIKQMLDKVYIGINRNALMSLRTQSTSQIPELGGEIDPSMVT